MFIFAVGNNNNNHSKGSKNLAYMQIRQKPMDLRKSNAPEFRTLNGVSGSGLASSGMDRDESICKKPVTTTLRGLSIGGVAKFPWEQRTSVLVIANRLKKELARLGWDYDYCDDEDNFIVKITRVS